MGLFSKSQNDLNTIEADRIAIKHLQEEMAFQKQAVINIEHAILKLDGHIKSLRGSFNQFKFRNKPEEPEEEELKTSKPTDVLRGL